MSRRTGSSSSAALSRAEQIASGRLRMDRNPAHARITDPSLAAGRRKEIDNVMKRARASSPGSWDRKLLEVEEKDPNRWRHTGYKQLYLETDRSPPQVSSTVPSHRPPRDGASTSISGPIVSSSHRRPEPSSSQSLVSSSKDRDRERERERDRDRERERERERDRDRRPPRTRPPSPPPPRRGGGRSEMASSVSSCSDDSCSVCSGSKPHNNKHRSRSRSFSVPRSSRPPPPARPPPPPQPRKLTKPLNSGNANAGPSSLSLRRTAATSTANPTAASSTVPQRINTSTTKKPKPPGAPVSSSSRPPPHVSARDADPAKKRSRDEKVLEWQRTQLATHKPRRPDKNGPPTPPAIVPSKPLHKAPLELKMRIKKEGERPKKKRRPEETGRAVSPGAIAAALADSSGEDDSTSEDDSLLQPHPHQADTRLTLSERFGKMAQWSADRSNGMQNMRITRGAEGEGGALTVRIEEHADLPGDLGTPPHRTAHSPAPEGHYPDELLTAAPVGLPSWDDVRVRYDYYKKRGYLRGLTLSDYIKWEEWWYRYQQWLKQERNYERWLRGSGSGSSSRRRRTPHHPPN